MDKAVSYSQCKMHEVVQEHDKLRVMTEAKTLVGPEDNTKYNFKQYFGNCRTIGEKGRPFYFIKAQKDPCIPTYEIYNKIYTLANYGGHY